MNVLDDNGQPSSKMATWMHSAFLGRFRLVSLHFSRSGVFGFAKKYQVLPSITRTETFLYTYTYTIQFYPLPLQDDSSRLVETKKVKSGAEGPSAAMMNQHDIQSKRAILGCDSFDCDMSDALAIVPSSHDQGTQALVSKAKAKASSSARQKAIADSDGYEGLF